VITQAGMTGCKSRSITVRLNGPEAAGKNIQLNLYFEDSDEHYLLSVRNGVLKSWAGRKNQAADASIKLTRNALIAMTIAGRPLETLIEAELISVEGDTKRLIEFLSLLDQFEFWFNIVTP
jgi:alkyl sulfatase BDS1-like metallo-beta-lactamase superfamily hydrolase